MSSQEYSANYNDFAGSSPINALEFFVKSLISKTVYTAFPVTVTAVERTGTGSGAGYVTVKPLLMPRNVEAQGIAVTTIPKLPYFRLQHGTAAVVCDPKVGDVGLAVVAKHDISNVNGDNTPKVPATFREFDRSDSFYIGGFWGPAPSTFIHIEDSGEITVEAPASVVIKTDSCTINGKTIQLNGSTSISLNSPQINLNGAIIGGGSGGANATFSGDVKAKGVSLTTHVHTGVQAGNTTSGQPQQ